MIVHIRAPQLHVRHVLSYMNTYLRRQSTCTATISISYSSVCPNLKNPQDLFTIDTLPTLQWPTILHKMTKFCVTDTPIFVLVVICNDLGLLWSQIQHLVTADGQTTGKLYNANQAGNRVGCYYKQLVKHMMNDYGAGSNNNHCIFRDMVYLRYNMDSYCSSFNLINMVPAVEVTSRVAGCMNMAKLAYT